ncbi:anaerobic sulfatase maturase [Clostridium sp. KNHs214]|uniref:anaerobic sulfatase maturase n=1 Tax=Clostridium sp. KNHs214 TaxID=1540257 RepID=UPI000A4DF8C3|nr:anaerobic sulfatase maturase [Clostridium sp. KNHs214]
MRRNLSMMIKPSSSKCNLNCKYCFYNSISHNRNVKDYGFMCKETIGEIVKKAKEFCNGGICTIGFQGGEPLLVGIDFYRHLVDEIEKNNNGTKFNLTIQTNGTLINKEWASFFKDYNFLVGVSLDGIEEVNDLNRVNYKGNGTFHRIMRGIEFLKKYHVEFNILTVVTEELSNRIQECYEFYKSSGFRYIQFITYLNALEENEMVANRNPLTPKKYGEFLIELFNMWYRDVKNNNYISIRFFDNILSLFLGYEYEACEMRGICSCQNIIESDGSVFPCDFYTYEKYSVGNILKENFKDILEKQKTMDFIKGSINSIDKCHSCKYNVVCRGGCRRRREDRKNFNYLCESYYKFYDYSFCKFRELATLQHECIEHSHKHTPDMHHLHSH